MRTFNDIKKSDNPALSVIVNSHGRTVTKAIIIIALDDLIEFYNVKMNFSDGQINQTADLIIDKFYWLKVDDFKLCFSRAKTGEYGQAYNRLDGPTIFEWINRYVDERAEFYALENENKNELPAVRANTTKEIHSLYDQVVKKQEEENDRKAKIEVLRKEAIAQWHEDYNAHFEGKEITPELHEAYIAKFPLNESYIKFYINKNLQK